jgi:hypothetical protein
MFLHSNSKCLKIRAGAISTVLYWLTCDAPASKGVPLGAYIGGMTSRKERDVVFMLNPGWG